MWEAPQATGKSPLRLSFTGTLHRMQCTGLHLLAGAVYKHADPNRLAALLRRIATDVVPDRPGRFEPRVLKRRRTKYEHFAKSRAEYHAEHAAA